MLRFDGLNNSASSRVNKALAGESVVVEYAAVRRRAVHHVVVVCITSGVRDLEMVSDVAVRRWL